MTGHPCAIKWWGAEILLQRYAGRMGRADLHPLCQAFLHIASWLSLSVVGQTREGACEGNKGQAVAAPGQGLLWALPLPCLCQQRQPRHHPSAHSEPNSVSSDLSPTPARPPQVAIHIAPSSHGAQSILKPIIFPPHFRRPSSLLQNPNPCAGQSPRFFRLGHHPSRLLGLSNLFSMTTRQSFSKYPQLRALPLVAPWWLTRPFQPFQVSCLSAPRPHQPPAIPSTHTDTTKFHPHSQLLVSSSIFQGPLQIAPPPGSPPNHPPPLGQVLLILLA